MLDIKLIHATKLPTPRDIDIFLQFNTVFFQHCFEVVQAGYMQFLAIFACLTKLGLILVFQIVISLRDGLALDLFFVSIIPHLALPPMMSFEAPQPTPRWHYRRREKQSIRESFGTVLLLNNGSQLSNNIL